MDHYCSSIKIILLSQTWCTPLIPDSGSRGRLISETEASLAGLQSKSPVSEKTNNQIPRKQTKKKKPQLKKNQNAETEKTKMICFHHRQNTQYLKNSEKCFFQVLFCTNV